MTENEPVVPEDLEMIRQEIDRVDGEILKLLGERRAFSVQIVQEKRRSAQPFRDWTREEDLLADRISTGESHALEPTFVNRVWKEIIADSLQLQQEHLHDQLNGSAEAVTAAFQGIDGSYSQLAAQHYFDARGVVVSYLGCAQFRDVVEAVEEGRADVAVLPTENTTSGGITEVYDLLLHSQLSLVGEIKFRIHHCLLGIEGATLSSLQTVYAHPQAVAQCSLFLEEMAHTQIIYFSDTALSGRKIKEMNDPAVAAIASEEAARLFDLRVLRSGIGNRAENYTRFVVAARKPIEVDEQFPSKTSLVMAVGNEPGALLEALAVFRDEGINLVKLESRPIPHNPFEEMFYVDLDGNTAELRVKRALDDLTRRARFLKVLGSYPSQDLRPYRAEPLMPLPSSDVTKPRRDVPAVAAKPIPAEAPKGYRLGSRSHKENDTVIDLPGVKLGVDDLVVIAGPCAVESSDQVMACAEAVRENGGSILRGGCFKPRTSPYSFQGLGYEGLEMLVEAGRAFELPVVTEVLAPEDVERVAAMADILQIGARNMQNFTLLAAVGRAQRPVMLKRGMSSSLDELLQAAEYILSAGNLQVFLCERGIRTFETSTRNTLDVSAVPVLQRRTHLPVIVDPSHAAGERELVLPLALAAQAAGAHGLMVEIHPNPDEALSDGPQSLTLDQYGDLMTVLQSADH